MKENIFIIISLCLLISCTGSISTNNEIVSFLEKKEGTSFFALYDYPNEKIVTTNINQFKIQNISADQFANFISAAILIESGGVFNEEYDKVNTKNISLKDAFMKQDTTYFKTRMNQLDKHIFDTFARQLRIINIDTNNNENNYSVLYSQKLSYDQIMGFISKYYFNKLGFQERTKEIINKLYTYDTLNANPIAYIKYDTKKEHILLGYIEDKNRPYFFLYSYTATMDRATLMVDLKTFLNYIGI